MSEGFLSRWSRLKKKNLDGSIASDDVAEPVQGANGSGLSQQTVNEPQAPAQLMPWAGVNPEYQRQFDEGKLTGLEAGRSPALVEEQTANQALLEAKPETATADPSSNVLPDIGSLNMESNFKPFMQASVPAEARNAALKKLFADPSFNIMDGLDTYVADYSQPDPIPAEMLKELLKSKALCLFDDVIEGEEERPLEAAGEPGTESLEPDADGTLNAEPVLVEEPPAVELSVEEHLRLVPGPRVAPPPVIENEKQKGELGG